MEVAGNSSKCGWRKKPVISLHSEVAYVGPTGQIGRYIEDPTHNPHMPSVDGKPDSRRSMFMFTHNQVSLNVVLQHIQLIMVVYAPLKNKKIC